MKIELYNDHFENAKRYQIPRAQLIIADIPYNIGTNAYGSRSDWYIDGDNKNGESNKAGKTFFDTDDDFKIWQQLNEIREYAKGFGFKHAQPLFFIKKTSSQVLKANMRVCGATETAIVLYRDKLPKFNNNGRMILDWFEWDRGGNYPKIHPTQKPIPLLKQLIQIYTDIGDVVIDPVAGSGSTLRACAELNRSCYGFEIKKEFYNKSKKLMLSDVNLALEI